MAKVRKLVVINYSVGVVALFLAAFSTEHISGIPTRLAEINARLTNMQSIRADIKASWRLLDLAKIQYQKGRGELYRYITSGCNTVRFKPKKHKDHIPVQIDIDKMSQDANFVRVITEAGQDAYNYLYVMSDLFIQLNWTKQSWTIGEVKVVSILEVLKTWFAERVPNLTIRKVAGADTDILNLYNNIWLAEVKRLSESTATCAKHAIKTRKKDDYVEQVWFSLRQCFTNRNASHQVLRGADILRAMLLSSVLINVELYELNEFLDSEVRKFDKILQVQRKELLLEKERLEENSTIYAWLLIIFVVIVAIAQAVMSYKIDIFKNEI